MKLSQLLSNAKALIQDEKSWTKGEYARDQAGVKIADNHDDACQWCAVGALWRVSGFGREPYSPSQSKMVNKACFALLDAIGRKKGLSYWNDDPETTHQDVINAFDKAIEGAQYGS